MISINWFECKITTEKDVGEGKIKKCSETYLVDAMSFTEAEARIQEEVSPFYSEFDVTNIKHAKYSELFESEDENDDKWFKVKYNCITIDDNGNEKKSALTTLVQASSLENALNNFKTGMRDSMIDYEIALIQETPILDVFKLKVEE